MLRKKIFAEQILCGFCLKIEDSDKLREDQFHERPHPQAIPVELFFEFTIGDGQVVLGFDIWIIIEIRREESFGSILCDQYCIFGIGFGK